MRRRTPVLLPVALVALVIVVLLAVASTAGPAAGRAGDPSSRSSGRDGTLALYTWLGDLGYEVHRLSGNLDTASTDALIVVAPAESYTDGEIARVDGFLRSGGELVLAVDAGSLAAAQPLLDDLGVAVDRAASPNAAYPTVSFQPAGAVRRVDFADGSLDLGHAGVPLLRLPDRTTALTAVAVGGGRAFVLGSPYPLSNEGLRPSRPAADGTLQSTSTDADALVLALLERLRPAGGIGRIGFDEVHHGEGAAGGLGAILISPAGLASLLALVVVLAWLGTSGRRLGRAVPAGDPAAVPSAATFIGAMARLYQHSAQRGAVAARYAEELKGRLCAAGGVDSHLDDTAFLAALAGHGGERAADVGQALATARSMAAGTPSEGQLVDLARRVDAVERRWTSGGPQ